MFLVEFLCSELFSHVSDWKIVASGVSAGKNQRVKSSCQVRSFYSHRTIERAGAECAIRQEQREEQDFLLANQSPNSLNKTRHQKLRDPAARGVEGGSLSCLQGET